MNAARFCPAAPHETCILLHSFPRPYPITSYPSTRITNPSPASTAHTKPFLLIKLLTWPVFINLHWRIVP